ncbi:MAG: PIN domain-containing protein [Ferruginibacter sp.]|nr:PIN domain-containing protein [Ferruginibacter sp.]
MMLTKDKCFVDSNICLYLLDIVDAKKEIAKTILKTNPTISTQVINENVNILFKKYKHLSNIEVVAHTKFLMHNCIVEIINEGTIAKALFTKEKYQLQWYDSLIVASALEANCTILYTEDMHHGLIIEGTLSIINPFM